jgi:predicted DNA binding CopG/RHH family protein
MPKPKRTLKRIPTFKTEAEERQFWTTHDTTEYFDWSKARRVRFPNLRPSTTAISLRLPDTLLTELKLLANERDVPYQSLLKVYLADRVSAERKQARARRRPNPRLEQTGA